MRFIASFIYRNFLEKEGWLRDFLIGHTNRIYGLVFKLTLLLYPLFWAYSWIRIGARRLLGLKPAVLWAPTPILTITESSNVLKRLGYPSVTLVFTTYHITNDFDLNLKRLILDPAVNYWLPNALFLWALVNFDVFHFFYDGGLWSGMKIIPAAKWIELPLLRLAGKRIVASAYGADVRMKHLNEMWQPFNICKACPEPGKHCICDGRGLVNAKYYRDWCNEILAMGDMHDFVFESRRDINYWPIDVQKIGHVGVTRHAGPVRIVHSPNHRHFKGTRYLEAAIESLKSRGYSLELVMVEGMSNADAKKYYAEADIVFAQCLAGWMGYTEIEAMAAGKPVIGYIRNYDYLSHSPECPMVSANPENLEYQIERLVKDPDLRQQLGERGRRYIEKYWSYEAVAPIYDELHGNIWHNNDLVKRIIAKKNDFLHGETRYRVGSPLEGPALGEWVVWSDPKLNMNRIEKGIYGQPPFDAENLLRVFYNGEYVSHPGAAGLYALNAFHNMLAEPDTTLHKERFGQAANWLKDKLEVDESGVGRWFYHFKAVGRDLPTPWVSCFSQSIGLSILLRANQVFHSSGFDRAAKAAAQLFRVPIADGGILWMDNGLVYLEEYPEATPSHVLNGFITGMFGLYEYHKITGEAWAKDLFLSCLNTIKLTLDKYETPHGLRYDLVNSSIVNADYYYFQIQQLLALHAITGDRFYRDRAERWRRRMYKMKIRSFLSGAAPI